ncbi:hypothetical protein B0T16DRAFT_407481 [Cercophora newfieldiana]|uniref:Uncharacterized protein n=1 Tax=Cercophora newfieldiana TaxID=92897 RepID=A0AA39YKA7_9PEZI|nr:hypothetical protein B0T16DRAFT_407481 [Cercophora newfieldiana]
MALGRLVRGICLVVLALLLVVSRRVLAVCWAVCLGALVGIRLVESVASFFAADFG